MGAACSAVDLTAVHDAERRLLSLMPGTKYEAKDVRVRLGSGNDTTVRTIIVGTEHSDKLPIVLIHGFMMGAPGFFKWFPLLAKHRTVYAIDVLGMGGSGRPPFDASSMSAEEAEVFLVKPFEEWADIMGLSAFALLGHSFGGFVASSWAIRYPSRIKVIGLLSPLLGFSDARRARIEPGENSTWSQWAFMSTVDAMWSRNFTPQSLIRGIPGASGFFQRASENRFQSMASNVSEEEGRTLSEYVVASMALPSSAEQAATVCFGPFLRAAEVPGGTITTRLARLTLPMFVIYGDRDWMERVTPIDLPNSEFIILRDSGHHHYLDNPVELTAQVLPRLPLS